MNINFISSYSCSPYGVNSNIDDIKVQVSIYFVIFCLRMIFYAVVSASGEGHSARALHAPNSVTVGHVRGKRLRQGRLLLQQNEKSAIRNRGARLSHAPHTSALYQRYPYSLTVLTDGRIEYLSIQLYFLHAPSHPFPRA